MPAPTTPTAPIDTKSAPHRTLAFETFKDILDEVNRIGDAVESETAATTGNWTIGEIGDHCATLITGACDGFATRAPAPLRWIARTFFFKKAMGPEPMPPGFKLPKSAAEVFPEPGIADTEGIANLRKELKRVIAGKEMANPSPLFGRITHDQWVTIHTKHCAMHLGFITYPGAPDAARTGPTNP